GGAQGVGGEARGIVHAGQRSDGMNGIHLIGRIGQVAEYLGEGARRRLRRGRHNIAGRQFLIKLGWRQVHAIAVALFPEMDITGHAENVQILRNVVRNIRQTIGYDANLSHRSMDHAECSMQCLMPHAECRMKFAILHSTLSIAHCPFCILYIPSYTTTPNAPGPRKAPSDGPYTSTFISKLGNCKFTCSIKSATSSGVVECKMSIFSMCVNSIMNSTSFSTALARVRTFSSTTISPSSKISSGLIFSIVPRIDCALRMRPLRSRYSSVSAKAAM